MFRHEVDSLLKQHRQFVRMIAFKLTERMPSSVQLDDMIQAGMIGLWEAIGRFDGRSGVQFKTFAASRIRGAMLDELRGYDRVFRNVVELEDKDLLDTNTEPCSILELKRKVELLLSLLENLSKRDKLLMTLHYEQGLDFTAISSVLGLGPSRTSQIHGEIIRLLEVRARASSCLPSVSLKGKDWVDDWLEEFETLIK